MKTQADTQTRELSEFAPPAQPAVEFDERAPWPKPEPKNVTRVAKDKLAEPFKRWLARMAAE